MHHVCGDTSARQSGKWHFNDKTAVALAPERHSDAHFSAPSSLLSDCDEINVTFQSDRAFSITVVDM